MITENYQVNESSDSLTVLQRVAQGDREAVKDCIDKYGNLVWHIARKSIRNKEDAEDAVQEIFIDIWKNAARFDPVKSPEGAFITLIARRRIIDRVRRTYIRPQISVSENALENQASNEHEKLHRFIEIKPILEALNKLKTHQKQIIGMAVFEGMTHTEIAKTIGLPIGTVKTHIRRGFKKIRDSIGIAAPSPI
jgi:RNA polymerase sigma-70 factor (ECF subfamily)